MLTYADVCHRSHEELLKLPSELFYDNTLVAAADPESTNRCFSSLRNLCLNLRLNLLLNLRLNQCVHQQVL